MPARCSSPATPGGTGWSDPSRMYVRWLAMGRPYGMLVHAGSTSPTSYTVEWIELSVAPPSATNRSPGAARRVRSGSESGTQSPPSRARRRASSGGAAACSSCSTTSSRRAGAEFQTVIRWVASSSAQCCGSLASAGSGSTTVPPAAVSPRNS
ncbi:hypothetical protein SMICM17S_03072 [Streptomyces microflavus]